MKECTHHEMYILSAMELSNRMHPNHQAHSFCHPAPGDQVQVDESSGGKQDVWKPGMVNMSDMCSTVCRICSSVLCCKAE